MKCNHCGAEIASDSVFCEHCGKKIGEEPKASEDKKDKKMNPKTIGFIAGGVVVVALLAILLWPKGVSGLYPVTDEYGKFGYIDHNGSVVITPQYGGVCLFSEGLARVWTSNEKYGYINESGKIVISAQYDYAHDFSDGLALVRLNGEAIFINKEGETVITTTSQYDNVEPFHEGLACVGLNGKYGFIDKIGNLVIPFLYDNAEDFNDGLAEVGANGKYGYINKEGKLVIPMQFSHTRGFSEGLAAVWSDSDKGGYIDKEGKLVIPYQFDNAWFFKGDWAPVCINKKWGFIDKKGNYVINPQYDDMVDFSEDVAVVRLDDNNLGIIDKNGKLLKTIQGNDPWGQIVNDFILVNWEDGNYAYCSYLNKSGNIVYEWKVKLSHSSAAVEDSTFIADSIALVEEMRNN